MTSSPQVLQPWINYIFPTLPSRNLGARIVLENLPHTTAVHWHVPEDSNVHSTRCQSFILTVTSDKGHGLQHPRPSPPSTKMYTQHHRCLVCHLLKLNILSLKQTCIRVNAVIRTISLLKGIIFLKMSSSQNRHTTHYTVKKFVFYRYKLKYGCRLSSSANDSALCVESFS